MFKSSPSGGVYLEIAVTKGGPKLKLSGLQVIQLLGMFIGPGIIAGNVHGLDSKIVWSCVVVAVLFVGVSICSVANAIGARSQEHQQP